MCREIINQIKTGYKQSWFEFLFKWTSLGQLISQDKEPSAYDFFSTYMNSWWLVRRWFRSRLDGDSLILFDNMIEAQSILREHNLFSKENLEAVVSGSSNSKYLNLPIIKADELRMLNLGENLTSENRTLVARHPYPYDLSSMLNLLKRAEILTAENRELLSSYNRHEQLLNALYYLKDVKILNQSNFKKAFEYANIRDLGSALMILQNNAKVLDQNYFEMLLKHPIPIKLADTLYDLKIANMLSEANRVSVFEHTNFNDLSIALHALVCARILDQNKFNIVYSHPKLSNLSNVLLNLWWAKVLNQENFDRIIAPNHEELISTEALTYIWGRIPSHLLNQANFERLLFAAQSPNPIVALQAVRDQIMGVERPERNQQVLNDRQSTHTASVHRTVSDSAIRLENSYVIGFNQDQSIQEIKSYISELEESLKHSAAKRCINRITNYLIYNFTDPGSKVSLQKLLALTWVAINDANKRKDGSGNEVSFEDAKALFVEGLYEIQRGYNLDPFGKDLGGNDRSICQSGTFNKLMEKLNGIHQDVKIDFITHQLACAKLPKKVQEHAIDYLEKVVDKQQVLELLERIEKEGNIEPIWEYIKKDVQEALWDEFKEAYGSNEKDQRFLDMIELGYETNIPNLHTIKEKIKPSHGDLQANSLWEKVTQHNFDLQYGVIVKP